MRELNEGMGRSAGVIQNLETELARQKETIDRLQVIVENPPKPANAQNDPAIAQNVEMLMNKFSRLKEYSDKQIQMIEKYKLENLQLMNEMENFKSLVRSSNLHAEKAEADAEAYAHLLKQMEAKLAESEIRREMAEGSG